MPRSVHVSGWEDRGTRPLIRQVTLPSPRAAASAVPERSNARSSTGSGRSASTVPSTSSVSGSRIRTEPLAQGVRDRPGAGCLCRMEVGVGRRSFDLGGPAGRERGGRHIAAGRGGSMGCRSIRDRGAAATGVEIRFHGEASGCDGHFGLALNGHVDIYTTLVNAMTRRLVLHEMSHIWLNQNVGAELRRRFMQRQGIRHWNDLSEPWRLLRAPHGDQVPRAGGTGHVARFRLIRGSDGPRGTSEGWRCP
jgi:hypothetical protein